MSNEQNTPEEDRLVAEAYADLARERVPDRLDAKVLRMAARGSRSRYALAIAWMRPVAWAATIALSLAIVLEVTRAPQSAIDLLDRSEPALAAPESASVDEIAPRDFESSREASENVQAEAASQTASRDAFVPQEMEVVREAENRARAQAGPDQPAVPVYAEPEKETTEVSPTEALSTAVYPAAVANKRALQREPSCPASDRKQADLWFECIEDLRESGKEIDAEREYEEFRKIYPDFAEPQADK